MIQTTSAPCVAHPLCVSDTALKSISTQREALETLSMAKLGDREAQFKISEIFKRSCPPEMRLDGEELELEEHSIRFCQAAASQGHIKALNTLGFRFEEGIGVRKNLFEAAKYYAMASEQNDSDTTGNIIHIHEIIATSFELGKNGFPKDLLEANFWKSIVRWETEEAWISKKFIQLHAQENGPFQDMKQAAELFKRAV